MEAIIKKIQNGAKVIDVRTPAEYAGGHFQGAENIPVQELHFRLNEIGSKEEPIVLYCASGSRSGMAAMMLAQAGYTDVVNGGGVRNMAYIAGALN